MFLCLILFALLGAQAHNDTRTDTKLVTTSQGPIRGYREDDIFAFYSIPYATARTGRDRYKAPIEGPTWTEPFEAIYNAIYCPQTELPGIPGIPTVTVNRTVTIQEDCLVAHVYIPDTNETNLPVVVYVHGGGFSVGHANLLTPKYLVRSKKVIAVTFNYRLGIHGFLCLGTGSAPGNAGMKDQLALLRWVNKNIASFGGNPNEVTIAGYSAGGGSVDLLMLSQAAQGLFNKVIPESGANVAVFAVQLDPIEVAKEYASHVGFTNTDDLDALEEFYMSAPLNLILNTSRYQLFTDSTVGFTPCMERDIGQERFLEDAPVDILKSGNYNKMPILYGFTDMEGLLRMTNGLFDIWKTQMNDNFSDFLPADLHFENMEQKEQVAKEVKEFYFGDNIVSEDTILAYIDYFTDVMFAFPTLRAVKLHVENGHNMIYLYEYAFAAEEKDFLLGDLDFVRGADHTDQTWAVLDIGNESFLSERTRNMKAFMRELWLNFITTGTPVPSGSELPAWPAVGADRSPHMFLNETSQLRGPLLQQRAQFWDGLYERYYRAPAAPSAATIAYLHSLLISVLLLHMF